MLLGLNNNIVLGEPSYQNISLTNLAADFDDISGLTDLDTAAVTTLEVVDGTADAVIAVSTAAAIGHTHVALWNVSLPQDFVVNCTVGTTFGPPFVHSMDQVVRSYGGTGKRYVAWPMQFSGQSLSIIIPANSVSSGSRFTVGELTTFSGVDIKIQAAISDSADGGIDVQSAESGRTNVLFTPLRRRLTVQTIPLGFKETYGSSELGTSEQFNRLDNLRYRLNAMPATVLAFAGRTPDEAAATSRFVVPLSTSQIASPSARYFSMRMEFADIVSIF